MIQVLIGFILWPISGLIYIIMWNFIIKFTKSHPMFLRNWYECIAGAIILFITDIKFMFGNRNDGNLF